jgi:hypothetical protein
MAGRTPAQLYALVFGAVLLLVGILGFFLSASFATGDAVAQEKSTLILFDINGYHNVIHLASGAVGLAMAATPASARLFALGFGVVYGLVTVLGFVLTNDMEVLLGIIPINMADNFLHLAISALGIAAGLASSTAPKPSTA